MEKKNNNAMKTIELFAAVSDPSINRAQIFMVFKRATIFDEFVTSVQQILPIHCYNQFLK